MLRILKPESGVLGDQGCHRDFVAELLVIIHLTCSGVVIAKARQTGLVGGCVSTRKVDQSTEWEVDLGDAHISFPILVISCLQGPQEICILVVLVERTDCNLGNQAVGGVNRITKQTQLCTEDIHLDGGIERCNTGSAGCRQQTCNQADGVKGAARRQCATRVRQLQAIIDTNGRPIGTEAVVGKVSEGVVQTTVHTVTGAVT